MSFLQTEKWSEFQKALGADYFKIGDIFVFKYKLPFNKYYFYIPRADFTNENLKNIINEAQTMNPVFLRIEPEAKKLKNASTANFNNIRFKKKNIVNFKIMGAKRLLKLAPFFGLQKTHFPKSFSPCFILSSALK